MLQPALLLLGSMLAMAEVHRDERRELPSSPTVEDEPDTAGIQPRRGVRRIRQSVHRTHQPEHRTRSRDGESQITRQIVGTNLVFPQRPGELQLGLWSDYERRPIGDLQGTGFAAELGLTAAWQVAVAWEALLVGMSDERRTYGVGEVLLETQYSFMRIGGSPLHASLGMEVGLPTAAREVTGVRPVTEYEPYGIVAVDAGRHIHLFVTPSVQISTRAVAAAAAGGVVAQVWRLRPYTTVAWRDHGLTVNPGLNVALPRRFEVGAGVPIGVYGEAPRLGLTAQLLFAFDAW